MTADEFAARLASIAPSVQELVALGLGIEEAEAFRRGYFCRRISQSGEPDPLLDLCRNFDVSTMVICAVTFHSPHEFDADNWAIGFFESDTIVYPKSGGVVSVRDHENLRRTLCKCAMRPEGFLRAMLVVAEFVTRSLLDPKLEADRDAGYNALMECLRWAGSEECRSFYFVLLGLE